jgi:hypothetical protein
MSWLSCFDMCNLCLRKRRGNDKLSEETKLFFFALRERLSVSDNERDRSSMNGAMSARLSPYPLTRSKLLMLLRGRIQSVLTVTAARLIAALDA